MPEFDEMPEDAREKWFTDLVVAAQAGITCADDRSQKEMDAFLLELRLKLLGY